MRRKLGTIFLLVTFALTGCGEPEAVAPSPAAPDKTSLVSTLRAFLAALQAGDLERARGFLVEERARKGPLADLDLVVAKRELESGGIDQLEAKGRFGPLLEIYGTRGAAWAEEAEVDVASCYGLAQADAEVAAVWDGARFRLFLVDDVRDTR